MSDTKKRLQKRNEVYQLCLLHVVSKALHIASKYELDKRLSDNPISIDLLAQELKLHPTALFKFLRLLDAYEIVELVNNDSVKAGRLTDQLIEIRTPHVWNSYDFINNLENTLATNQESHTKTFGKAFYPYILDDEQSIENFREWCTRTAKDWLPVVIDCYNFSQYSHIIDIGGGEGYFIAELLKRNKKQHGTLFDQPAVVNNAEKIFKEYGVADRANVIGGDFFKQLPTNGDAYAICRTLLNWSDDDALRIINNCFTYMKPGTKLLVIDFMIPTKGSAGYKFALMNDINLLTGINSQIRTKEQWLDLVKRSKFTVTQHVITPETPELFYPLIVVEVIKEK